jgi:CYTH domain-containing protein
MNSPIETERKFLIRMPNTALLSSLENARVMNMEQTYLVCENGNARVRRIEEGGKVRFIKTLKQRISTLSCYEFEEDISAQQ